MKDAQESPRHQGMNRLTALLAVLLFPWLAVAQSPKAKGAKSAPSMTDAPVKHEDKVYKKTPQGELTLHFAFPVDWESSDKRPAIVFFFGGGWKNGSYQQFVSQSDYFASRGMVAASADYRIESVHHTTPD